MDARVAKRYGRALFSAAKREKILESVESDLDAIAAAMANHPQFRRVWVSPEVSREEKTGLLERVFSDRVTALTMGMLRLLLDKRREDEIDLMRLEFVRLRREHDNVLFATVTSAKPMSEQERKALVTKLQTSTGKRVEAEFEVDSNLMGGVKVAYDNFVLDGTVRGSLSRLRETLIYDLLKQR